jgi:small neutral amino acid transporter SnatA (MarC family)
LFGFLFCGDLALGALHLKQEAVAIAGGIILFLIGIRMTFPTQENMFGEPPGGEPFIVPMAIPGIAGPSTMAMLLLLGHESPERRLDWSVALVIAWLATGVILFAATSLYRLLGVRVLIALERLMGMLLVAVSVQMFLDGLASYLKG